MRLFKKVVISIFSTAISLAALFFGIIGLVALVTHQDYNVVMNVVFEWIKGLSNNAAFTA